MRLFRKIRRLLDLPVKMEVYMAEIDDAFVELDAAVAEVAQEMHDLADKVDAGTVNQDEVSTALRARAAQLRDISPSTPEAPPVEPPVNDVPSE